MADMGNNISNDVGQQGQELVNEAGKKIADKAGNQAKKVARRAGRAVSNKVRKATIKAGKAVAKTVKNTAQIIAKVIMHLVALFGGPLLVALALILSCVILWNFIAEERGSTESNDLTPIVDNPSVVDQDTGVIKAIAMTEPQAVIDAYYKLMSTSSFTKTYKDEDYVFNEPAETQDFAGLRDYFERENNFYLSDDFIRMMDELLHDNAYYFPEQIIKPVYGQKLTLKDKDGVEGTFYTARLPHDYKSGDMSHLFNEDVVLNFNDMINDKSQLDSPIGSDELPTLIAQSQKAGEQTDANGFHTYTIQERNVLDGTVPADAQSGVWDYGFGSVIQYQPEQKESYIDCTYTSVQIDIDKRVWVDGIPQGSWSDWFHAAIITKSLSGITTRAQLESELATYVSGLSSDTVEYTYNLPPNIEAIIDPTKNWDMSREPNATEEAKFKTAYNRNVSNNHIDRKIEDAKDADIDRLEFSDPTLTRDFGNVGGGLYPLNIAVANHAATFSGNIHYTIYPTTSDKCDIITVPLSGNTLPNPDHRADATVIQVAGSCRDSSVSNRTLKAVRTGNIITKTPHVEETASPWGFTYMQSYADAYVNYIPTDYMNDRDFFLRTGLRAEEGTPAKGEYYNNLKFLLDLGLLRPWNGNVSLNAVSTVNAADMGNSQSDLYILSHLIAAEAGKSKLDQLMVGATFVNRVHSNRFPNTYWEVLTQSAAYSSYPSMYDTPGHQPTDEIIASAMQVISGQFAIPENIVGQSGFVQGTIYKVVDNGPNANTHYYTTAGAEAISTVDRFGRPAPSADQLEALAAQLEGKAPADISVDGANFNMSTSCFIGDSLTVGLNATKGLSDGGATVIAEESASLSRIKQLVENAFIPSSVRTVYLLAGTNSCADYDDAFRNNYQAILTAIGQKAPQATIVLTTLPPCVDGAGHNASNAYITAKNQVINGIASAGGYRILDIWTSLQEDGTLAPGYSADGLHLTAAGYGVWFSQIQGGVTVSQVDIDNPAQAFENLDQDGFPIDSDFTLYDIANFDVLTAINMQAHVAQADSSAKSWLSNLVDNIADSVADFLNQFWDAISNMVFASSNADQTECFFMGTPYFSGDIKGVVYHTMTFATQNWYSVVEDAVDERLANGDITFLFVGKEAMLGLGTLGYGSMQIVPGVGTTIDGTQSPTSSYYPPLSDYDGTKVELNVPENTNVLAVADGRIIDVGNDPASDKGRYVTQEIHIDTDVYEVTYGYLATISVANGANVSKGDLIGTSGSKNGNVAGLYLRVLKNGVNVDPLSIFYQSTVVYGGGSLGQNLYNSDGTVNKESIKALEDQLTNIIGVPSRGTYYGYSKSMTSSPYHQLPINRLQGLQCTWWAWGRGYEYLCTIKNTTITKAQYAAAIRGNGGEYYDNNRAAGLFNYGSLPKPNSLVCYRDPGGYGHIAYVEAVDYVNRKYYESECGSGEKWLGLNERNFGYAPFWHGRQYTLAGFIYLDEPRV